MYNLINILKDFFTKMKLKRFQRFNFSIYRGDKKLEEHFDKYKADFDLEAIYKIQRLTKEGWHTYQFYPSKAYLHNLIYIAEYYLFINPREKVRIIDYTTGKVVYE